MTILVTGGTGSVGREAVARLVQKGHKVRVIGRRTGIDIEGADYRACDITDFDALLTQVRSMEAIVHLAAVPHPSLAPGQEIFRVNCLGTFHVYRAAADVGIRRVVTASSINALGYYFGVKTFPLHYLPIDEEHPPCTTDPYSFSKQILEETAAYFWRREGISSVCLRLPAVYERGTQGSRLRELIARARRSCVQLLQLPEQPRQARVQEVIARTEQLRRERAWEKPLDRWGMDLDDAPLVFGRSNFWTSVDARDSAQAIEKGLLANYTSSHPLYINDGRNLVAADSRQLVDVFYPEVTRLKHSLANAESLVSIDRARELIGFEPQHFVEDWFASSL